MSQLSSDDWLALIEIARRAISCAVLEHRLPDLGKHAGVLSERRGAFVSLYRSETLRGCVGQVENPGPLAEVVTRAAISAALYDSRFPPVGAEEVAALQIEISVLTAPEPIRPEAVIAGLHGLFVVQGAFRGLLLPQVAAERKWSSRRLLEETCIKAGLSRNAWLDPATQVLAFTAEVFSEKVRRTLSDA
jgi:AmmeMemoRadiSam system protein A